MDDDKDTKDAQKSDVWFGFSGRLKTDYKYRQQIIRTACLYSSMFSLGFVKGQIGPSLIDLQMISKVGLQQGSALLTTLSIGYMAGAFIGGYIFNKITRTLLLACNSVCLALATFLIPWCSWYWLMVVVFLLLGVCVGILDSVTNGDLQCVWGKDGRSFMQGLQLMFALGITLSPLVTAPFLSKLIAQPQDTKIANETNYTLCNQNHTAPLSVKCYNNLTSINYTKLSLEQNPHIFIAFIATSGISLTVGLCYFVFHHHFEKNIPRKDINNVKRNYQVRKLPKLLKCLTLAALVCLSGLTSSIDENFVGFLTTFCVRFLNWTASEGAFLTSMSNVSVILARISAVCLIQCIQPMSCTGFHCMLTLLSFVGLYISALHISVAGVWISCIAFGFGKSVIFASVFSWIEEIVTPVTGKVSASVFIIMTSFSAVNPLILGKLMEHLSTLWFVILLLAESVLLVFIYIVGLFLSKYIILNYGYTHHTEQQVVPREDLLKTTEISESVM